MRTVRTTLNLDAALIKEVERRHAGETRTHLIELGLAAELVALGGSAPHARRARRRQGVKLA